MPGSCKFFITQKDFILFYFFNFILQKKKRISFRKRKNCCFTPKLFRNWTNFFMLLGFISIFDNVHYCCYTTHDVTICKVLVHITFWWIILWNVGQFIALAFNRPTSLVFFINHHLSIICHNTEAFFKAVICIGIRYQDCYKCLNLLLCCHEVKLPEVICH